MKKNRRKARELALKGLYQWLLTKEHPDVIIRQLGDEPDYATVDHEHFQGLLRGVAENSAWFDAELAPCLDRPVGELSPIEHAALLLGAFELVRHPDIPYRVVINEAIELAKQFGGTDGHRFVNGVLDKLAATHRAAEVADRAARR